MMSFALNPDAIFTCFLLLLWNMSLKRSHKRPASLHDARVPHVRRRRRSSEWLRACLGEDEPREKSFKGSYSQGPSGHLEELFVQGELLGKGGNGCIFAGFRKTDGLPVKCQISTAQLSINHAIMSTGMVAIKYVLKSRANVVMDADGPLPLEVALMKRVNAAPACPYILQLIDWFDLPTEYALVLERPHPCQDLSGFCKAQGVLSEELAHYVLLQVVVALWHCQDRGVVHRDIKPSNLLIKTDTLQVKLIDFSCGKLLKDSPFEDFAGSLSYLPPEWFHDMKYLAGPATVWSLGVTLFQLVCGCWPFQRRKKTVHGRFKFPHWVSADCKRLIRWCLTPSVVYRPTLEKIALHPWFRGQ